MTQETNDGTECLGGCGSLTDSPTGYCLACRPEEDMTKYDTGATDDEARN